MKGEEIDPLIIELLRQAMGQIVRQHIHLTALQTVLVNSVGVSGREIVETHQSLLDQSRPALDALARADLSALFEWLRVHDKPIQ